MMDQYGCVQGLTGMLVVDASILPDCQCAKMNGVSRMPSALSRT
jgi:hypothetical protein